MSNAVAAADLSRGPPKRKNTTRSSSCSLLGKRNEFLLAAPNNCAAVGPVLTKVMQ